MAAGILFFSPGQVFLTEAAGGPPVAHAAVASLDPSEAGLPTVRILAVAGDRRARVEVAPQLMRFLHGGQSAPSLNGVPRDRIELSTHGFSVRCSTN
jgi:hypothetical protein